MKVTALKQFYDGWAKSLRKKGEIFEAPETAIKYWQGLGLIVEAGAANPAGIPDLNNMTKKEIVEFAQGRIELDQRMSKQEMIDRVLAILETDAGGD